MHHAGHIIKLPKVADSIGLVFVKVTLCASLNVLPCDAHEIVTFRCALHMIEAQCVQEFVNDRSQSEAAFLGLVQLKIDLLTAAVQETNIGKTTGT